MPDVNSGHWHFDDMELKLLTRGQLPTPIKPSKNAYAHVSQFPEITTVQLKLVIKVYN